MKTLEEREVLFVANPGVCPNDVQGVLYARPDGESDRAKKPWRQVLREYNENYRKSGENPYKLLTAADLYYPRKALT